MRTSAVAGIVFANANDDFLKKLTLHRSMASVPIGCRYRLIDFALSNLVNAGVKNVGVIAKEKYRSLMDHLGSGAPWDLDRKNGGLRVLPPYITSGAKRYAGSVASLAGIYDYIDRCGSDYLVLCDADIVANVDVAAALKAHVETEADVTVVYHNGIFASNKNERDGMNLTMDNNGRVTSITFEYPETEATNLSIGITIIARKLLKELVAEAIDEGCVSFNRDVLSAKVNSLKIYGFEHTAYVAVMNSTNSYFNANIDLLKPEVRAQVFNKERPVFTKTRDDMPTRYGTESVVKNSLIAEGCVIEGTVKNSLLFRGVKVQKGAVVENCILMQETVVDKNAKISNLLADKNAVISEDLVLKGTAKKHIFVGKNETV